MELTEFMMKFAPQLEAKAEAILSPLYKMQDTQETFGSKIAPYPIQREVVRAIHEGFKTKKAIFLTGEMGSGKTLMGILTSIKTRSKRTLIVCPPHLLSQWKNEILRAYPDKTIAIIPDQDLRRKYNVSNMQTLQAIHADGKVDYVIISREAIKTDLPRETANYRDKRDTAKCPDCFTELDYSILIKQNKAKTYCPECGGALYQYHRKDNRARPSLAKYIQKKMKGFFDLIIFDEVHELKAGDSAQGAVLGKLGGGRAKILPMTGTLMGGKASDIFYLLYRTASAQMIQEDIGYNQVTKFVSKYGISEKTVKIDDEDNKFSIGKKRNKEEPRERPGLSPLVVGKFLIDKTAFVRLSDFAEELPIYTEHPIACQMHPKTKEGYEMLMGYKNFLREASKPQKIISSAIQAMLRYTDTHKAEFICDDIEGEDVPLIITPEVDIPIGETDKEKELLKIVKGAKRQGNKVLIFTTQTKKRDLQPRIAKLLEVNNIKAAVMYNTVSTSKRDEWIKNKTAKIDALICHPKLVSTGMNLLEYPEIVFFDTGYSTYTLRQASRRSYRINQPRSEINVYYFYTMNTIQTDCLSLMAVKNEVSLMAEGEIQEGGLSLMANGTSSIMSQLAKVINGELKTENPLEVFSRLNKLNNEGKKRHREQPRDNEEEMTFVENDLPIKTVDLPPKVYIPPVAVEGKTQLSLW